MTLMVEVGRHYKITETPAGFLEMLRHLAMKKWANDAYFRLAIERVAAARGWDPGPLKAAINV